MISHNPYSNCTTARLYYYDFLSEQARESIPESTLNHIAECWDCQAEIDRLEMMFAHVDQSTEREQSWKDSAVSTLLKLHFAFLDEPVKCFVVKPFLASLADPALQIRIPTPITRHIEKCRACSDALMSLRELRLTHTQLCHLGRLLADEPAEGGVSCSQARAAVPAVASMAFQQTNAEILKHVCACPDCRKQLYMRREADRQKLLRSEAPQDEFPCEAVSASDIYDCVFPYGLDPAHDRHAEFRKPLIAHLQSCPTCLAKMQELHRKVSSIAERAESGIVTVYHLEGPVGIQTGKVGNSFAQAGSERDGRETCPSYESEIAAGVPTKVEENNGRGDVTRTIDFVVRLKRTVSAPSAKHLLKTSLAAAAIILIGLALLLNAPTAKAVTLGTIFAAVENARSVYIANFAGHATEPIQERWVSNGLNTYLVKTGSRWVLSDIGAGIRKSKDSRPGVPPEEVRLNEYDLADLKKTMSLTLAFMPFQKRSDVPTNAHWNRVTDAAPQSDAAGAEVYDLTWTEKTDNSSVHYRWRAFVDPQTSLPRRVELYQKRPVDSEYSLASVKQIKYITDAEIEAVIESVSF